MDTKEYTNEELDQILEDIDQKKYKGSINPERIQTGKDKESLSIPISGGARRRVFERDSNGVWEEAPYVGHEPLK